MKKKHGLLLGTAVILVTALFTLAGCDNGTGTGTEIRDGDEIAIATNVEIYKNTTNALYTGSGTVKLVYWPDEAPEPTFFADVGTVVNGKLTLNVPAIIEDQYLGTMEDSEIIEPDDTKISFNVAFMFFDSTAPDTKVGEIYCSDPDSVTDGLRYVYFSKAATMNGTLSNEEYDITAVKGWNKLYAYRVEEKWHLISDLNGIPSNLRWTIDD
jgi:hypothetical protein